MADKAADGRQLMDVPAWESWRRLKNLQHRYEKMDYEAEASAAQLNLVGRLVKTPSGGGYGLYRITEVRIGFNFAVQIKGRKLVRGGALGSQVWDLGNFSPSLLVAEGQRDAR